MKSAVSPVVSILSIVTSYSLPRSDSHHTACSLFDLSQRNEKRFKTRWPRMSQFGRFDRSGVNDILMMWKGIDKIENSVAALVQAMD